MLKRKPFGIKLSTLLTLAWFLGVEVLLFHPQVVLLLMVGVDRLRRFACRLRPRRPLRPAQTVPCSKVHRTFSLTATPKGSTPAADFSREKNRDTAFAVSLIFSGGDGGSRTHVRKHFQRTFSERS